jgi:hypothetical protein
LQRGNQLPGTLTQFAKLYAWSVKCGTDGETGSTGAKPRLKARLIDAADGDERQVVRQDRA